MKAKDLAEMMISGDLGYKPENDAYRIAKKYIQLSEVIEKNLCYLPYSIFAEITAVTSEDLAKPHKGKENG